jgi:hypothetical protein
MRTTPLPPLVFTFATALLLAAGTAARAQSAHEMNVGAQKEQLCPSGHVEDVRRKLIAAGQLAKNDMGDVESAACKAWPGDPGKELVAFAFDIERNDQKKLAVALVDTSSGNALASSAEVMEEDALMQFQEGSLWLDTARYELAPGVRAFGLDITSGYSPKCDDEGDGATRTLYVQVGTKLRKVLGGLAMSHWAYVKGGNPRCSDAAAEADPVADTATTTIGLASTTSHGYADLAVTTTHKLDGGKPSPRKTERAVMHYDGSTYH